MSKSQKGSSFERTICKQLSRWWTQDESEIRDDVFWRTSQSGGRATTRAKQNVTTAYSHGDITFIDPIGQPLIDTVLFELKRGYSKDISILDMVDKKKGQPLLLKWWEKARQEQLDSGRKCTAIIFKRDRHEPCIMMSWNLWVKCELWFGESGENALKIAAEGRNFVVIRFDHFLEWVHPNLFIKEEI